MTRAPRRQTRLWPRNWSTRRRMRMRLRRGRKKRGNQNRWRRKRHRQQRYFTNISRWMKKAVIDSPLRKDILSGRGEGCVQQIYVLYFDLAVGCARTRTSKCRHFPVAELLDTSISAIGTLVTILRRSNYTLNRCRFSSSMCHRGRRRHHSYALTLCSEVLTAR